MKTGYTYAVICSSTPIVYFAENEEVLMEVLAREVISQTPTSCFERDSLEEIRRAILARQWVKVLTLWIETTRTPVDIYPFGEVWTQKRLNSSSFELTVKESPLFKDSHE